MNKKILLGICMFILFIGIAQSVQARTEFADNFNRANSGTVGNSWVENPDSAYSIDTNQLVIDVNEANPTIIYREFTAFQPDYINFTFKCSESDSADRYATMFYSGANIPLRFGICRGEDFTRYNGGAWTELVSNGIADNTEYFVEIGSINYTAFTYNISIDGVSLGTGIAFESNEANIDEIRLSGGNNGAFVYFNNIFIGNISSTPPIPPPANTSNFDVTAIDNETSVPINIFNLTMSLGNGTEYYFNTANGTINTGFNGSISKFWNLTLRSNNYFDKTYSYYNISNDLQGVLLEYPKITTYNNWSKLPIDYFNLTIDSTTYLMSGRTIYLPFLTKKNVTILSNTTFSYSNELDFSDSTDYNISLKSSQVKFRLLQNWSGLQLNNFLLDLSGLFGFNTTGNNQTIYPSPGTYNVEIYSNDGSFKFLNKSTTITLFQNNTIDFYTYNYIYNFTAFDLITSKWIHNYSVEVSSLNRSDTRTYSTTSGNLSIPVIPDSYIVTLDADGFALRNYTLNVSSDGSKIFYLYTTNSFNLSFWDISTNTLITGRNITIEFIGPTLTNRTTDTGYVYIDLLVPGSYTFVYDSLPLYIRNQYITTLTNRSNQDIRLYLNKENTTTLVLINVRDKFGTTLEGVEVTIQRYTSNAWITEQILSTDFQGRTEGQFILSTTYYNFILEYLGDVYFGTPNNLTNKKLIYAEDVSSGLTFTIDTLGGSLLGTHQDTYDIVTNLTYIPLTNTSGYFRYYYNDPNNNQWTACLEVTKGGERTEVCSCASTRVTSESSIMTCVVNQSTGRELYTAKAIFEGGSVIDQFMTYIGQDTNIDWGITGYVIALFLVITSAFIFIKMPSWSILIATGVFVVCGMFGLIFRNTLGLMDMGVYIILLAIAFLISKIKSDSSGLEGS